jgi:DNA (cytosine-5)-methyltransferase 1
MAQGDRYPEAIAIAHRRFREALALEVPRPEPESPYWEDLKSRLVPPYRNDAFHDKWRKLVADEPSWTVTAHLSHDTYSHIHYDSRQARTITVREAARLQSFPDAVDFKGNMGEQYQQIGNAVPPVLARAIATNLLGQLEELEASRREAS